MTPERWREVTALFHAAVARSVSERDAFLDEACGVDAELRAEVKGLLVAHESAGKFGEAPVFSLDGDAQLERFRIVRRIGEGGMGVVYEAVEERPIRRTVALKVIRAGVVSEDSLVRFEAERQALALMSHPSIAHVFEAGTTADGRPYFAMELVEGRTITGFCREQRLDPRARIELFIQVCEGVQHAHQKGVIHRDLKPTNILVGIHDGKPAPKIIDFGVAKMTEGERGLTTEAGTIVGTLAYMSPEQADPKNGDVDTRTDVYALGVLLHELLTDVRPDAEPVPPSRKRPGLAADLDWIVLRALAHDRADRYDTASALALDLRRHLEDRPVLARAPTLGYTLGKLVRRHRLAVVAGALVAVALVAGGVVATVGLVRARRAEAKAVAVSAFLTDTLAAADPTVGHDKDVTVGQVLAAARTKAEASLQAQPEVLGAVLDTIGRSQRGLGRTEEAEPTLRRALEVRRGPGIQQSELAASLESLGEAVLETGKYAEAEPLFREALALRRAEGNDIAVAESLDDLSMTVARKGGDQAAAGKLLEEALALRTRALGERDTAVAQSLNNLGMNRFRLGKLSEAEPLLRKAIALDEALLGGEHPEVLSNRHNLALVLREKGAYDEAEGLFRQTLEVETRRLGPDHPRVGDELHELGHLYRRSGRPADAERAYQGELAIQEKHLPPESWQIAATRSAIAACLLDEGQPEAAESMLLASLPILAKAVGDGHPATKATLKHLVTLYQKAGAPDKAAPYQARLNATSR